MILGRTGSTLCKRVYSEPTLFLLSFFLYFQDRHSCRCHPSRLNKGRSAVIVAITEKNKIPAKDVQKKENTAVNAKEQT